MLPDDLNDDLADVALRLAAHFWSEGDIERAETWTRVLWSLEEGVDAP